MAVTSRGRTAELQIPKKWKDRETSPERNIVWTEPKLKTQRKVPVVYYLSRNGQLEQPHFMEVTLSSPEGLYLRGNVKFLLLSRVTNRENGCQFLILFYFFNFNFVNRAFENRCH